MKTERKLQKGLKGVHKSSREPHLKSYEMSHDIRDHTVLYATWCKWTCLAL